MTLQRRETLVRELTGHPVEGVVVRAGDLGFAGEHRVDQIVPRHDHLLAEHFGEILRGDLGLEMELAVRLHGRQRICQRAVEERDDLTAGAGRRPAEGIRRLAVGDAAFIRPEDGREGIMLLVQHVRKGRDLKLIRGLFGRAPEERRHLLARAGIVGAEMRRVRAGRDALFHRPEDGVIEIVRGLHVREGVLPRHLLRAEGTPEEGDDLAASAGVVRAEEAVSGAVRDLRIVVHGPVDGVIVVCAVLHILKARGGGAERQQRQNRAQRQQNRQHSFLHGYSPFRFIVHSLPKNQRSVNHLN